MGANVLIYGSVARVQTIFPACAMVDAIVAYTARTVGLNSRIKTYSVLCGLLKLTSLKR
jgi:tetrahydromethanopterin S-methyltransferase subunit H